MNQKIYKSLKSLVGYYQQIAPRLEVKKRLYGSHYFLNINDHISFILSPFDWEPQIKKVVSQKWGSVWDVGSNFGLFSIIAEKSGNKVVAFDPSPLAISHLRKSIKLNQCSNLVSIAKPLTTTKIQFHPLSNASCTNMLKHTPNGESSITYTEAADTYGVPSLIKMDIEGGEKSFLEDCNFIDWIRKHDISLLVELHGDHFDRDVQGLQYTSLSNDHLLYRSTETLTAS